MMLRNAAALVAVFLLAHSVLAEPTFTKVQGKVVAVGKDSIQMVTNENAALVVSMADNWIVDGVVYNGLDKPQAEFSGVSGPSGLRVGYFVRCKVAINAQLKVDGDVLEMTVFSPDAQTVYGYLPEIGGDATPKPQQPGHHYLVGRISALNRNGTASVAFPSGSATFSVPKNMQINFQANDYKVAGPGDLIEVEGYYLKLPNIYGQKVKITRPSPEVQANAAIGGAVGGAVGVPAGANQPPAGAGLAGNPPAAGPNAFNPDANQPMPEQAAPGQAKKVRGQVIKVN